MLRHHRQLTLIISAYCGDSFDWLSDVNLDFIGLHVYSKCQDQPPPRLPAGAMFQVVPNHGRESETFLRFLAEHIDEIKLGLPSHLYVFLQGHVHFRGGGLAALRFAESWVDTGLGFSTLGHVACESAFGCPEFKLMVNLHDYLIPTMKGRSWWTGFNGEFMVSGRRISKVPPWLFSDLVELMRQEQGSMAQHGHALERMWGIIFGCWAEVTGKFEKSAYPMCFDEPHAECGPNKEIPHSTEMQTGPPAQAWITSLLDPQTTGAMSQCSLDFGDIFEASFLDCAVERQQLAKQQAQGGQILTMPVPVQTASTQPVTQRHGDQLPALPPLPPPPPLLSLRLPSLTPPLPPATPAVPPPARLPFAPPPASPLALAAPGLAAADILRSIAQDLSKAPGVSW